MSSTDGRRPTSWRERLRGHLELARISLAPTVFTNVLAGTALAGAPFVDGRVGVLLAAIGLLYAAGMYLNDVFDAEFDREHRPERPIPSGRVSRQEAASFAAGYLAVAVVLLGAISWTAALCGAVMTALILAYDYRHRENPVASWVMGSIRGMVYVTVCVALTGSVGASELVPAALLALYIAGLTALAGAETDPDRFTYAPVLLLVPPAGYALVVGPFFASVAMASLFLSWISYTLRLTTPGASFDVSTAIGRLLAAICLVDALVLVAQGEVAASLVAVAAFGATIGAQQFVSGS